MDKSTKFFLIFVRIPKFALCSNDLFTLLIAISGHRSRTWSLLLLFFSLLQSLLQIGLNGRAVRICFRLQVRPPIVGNIVLYYSRIGKGEREREMTNNVYTSPVKFSKLQIQVMILNIGES